MQNILITWKDFFEVQNSVIEQIKQSGKTYKYVVALACGGLFPAYFVAKALDIPVVTINLKSYTDKTSGDIKHVTVDGFADKIQNQSDAIIVDDIYDSGKTIQYIQKLYPNVDTAITFARKPSNTATYVGKVLGHDEWLDFPWEVKYDCN